MKRIVLMIILWTLLETVLACDVCGGGSSSAYNGYIPRFGRSQWTLGYEHRSLKDASFRNETVDFQFTQSDLGWRFFSKKNLYFNATLPFKSLLVMRDQEVNTYNGLGDLRLAVHYAWKPKSWEGIWMPLMMVGTAWKSATGKYMVRDFTKQMMPLYLQNGTGANALQWMGYGQVANEKMGLWFNGWSQMSGVNEMQEQWGRRNYFQAGFFAHTQYFSFLKRSNQIWVNFSWLAENSQGLKSYQQWIADTQSKTQSFVTQLDWYFGDWVLTTYLGQNVMSVSETKIPISKMRMGINLVFVIPDRASE